MKAYITIEPVLFGFAAVVVTEQDYQDGGPHAHSYKTDRYGRRDGALADAKRWCGQHTIDVVEGPEQFS